MRATEYIDNLTAHGRYHFTTDDAGQELEGTAPAVRAALRRLREKGEVAVPYPWLGSPKRNFGEGRITLIYRMRAEVSDLPMRLKIEINSCEHFSVYGFESYPFEVRSDWFQGQASISSYRLEELLGSKLRALFQRRKSRDLFDLTTAIELEGVEPERIVRAFTEYMERGGTRASRAEFEANLESSMTLSSQRTSDLCSLRVSNGTWETAPRRFRTDFSRSFRDILGKEREILRRPVEDSAVLFATSTASRFFPQMIP